MARRAITGSKLTLAVPLLAVRLPALAMQHRLLLFNPCVGTQIAVLWTSCVQTR